MNVSVRATVCAMGIVALCAPARAGLSPRPVAGRVQPASIDNTATIGVNNLQMVVTNVGSFAYDATNHYGKADGLYFPRGTNKTVIFASGLWVGARINGTPRVTVAEYSTEYSPGGMSNGTFVPDAGRYHVYKINRGDSRETNPDYANWPFDDGAPALKNAAGSDSLDEFGNRIPTILGDQSLYAIYNDADPGAHTNGAGRSDPLGLEVQQYVFAFARGGALGNTVYLTFKIINKGHDTLEDTYVSLWSDPDVGNASDDLVGCDTLLSLGYAYNDGPDYVYGAGAPAVGFDFLEGPVVPAPGDSALQFRRYIHGFRNLPMTSFNKYVNGTDPTNKIESYNYMRGLWANGDSVTDDAGQVTPFQVAGDPVTEAGWIDVNAGDRRFMMSSGPFTMAPGDTQEVVVAVLVGQGDDHLSSITALKSVSSQAQAVFDLNFRIPFPPPQPQVWYQPLANDVELIWSTEAEGDVQVSDVLHQRFVMEGYNVYQGESQAGPWKKIATFDVDDDITRIYKDEFDPAIGAVQRVMIESGSNSGLKNHLSINTDRIKGGGLINHRPYYFAVTTYSYDTLNLTEYNLGSTLLGHLTEALETSPQAITVVPSSVALQLVDTARHVSGQSEGAVVIRYLDPANASGHDYEVTFNEDRTWNLTDLTGGTTVLADQANQSGDFLYPVTGGMMVQTIGPDPDVKDITWEGPAQWVTGVNWGGRFFGGGIDIGANFWGSSIEDQTQLVPVELRFSNTNKQKAYRYLRGANPNYAYQDYRDVPLTAWDISTEPPRQLNLCFIEQYALSSENGTWLPPDDDPETGGREYLFVLKSDYAPTPNEFYTTRSIRFDAPEFDVLYAWWPVVAAGHSSAELADGQIMRIALNKYNTSGDHFVFTAPRPGQASAEDASAKLKSVHPIPNPYFHTTDLEPGLTQRQIKFVNLPPMEATLEIYNLSGDLIRTVRKSDLTSDEIDWDVLTTNGLPPASGVYIYRITVPGLGEKVGKLAVFTEVEQLKVY